jgi:Pyridoxamine 5'-phosphate oxidase
MQSVVFRTAHGSKFHALLGAARAAFEIDGIDEHSRTGWSVIIHGVTEEIANPSDVRRLHSLGLETWALRRATRASGTSRWLVRAHSLSAPRSEPGASRLSTQRRRASLTSKVGARPIWMFVLIRISGLRSARRRGRGHRVGSALPPRVARVNASNGQRTERASCCVVLPWTRRPTGP